MVMKADASTPWARGFGADGNWQHTPGYLLGFTQSGDTEPSAFSGISAMLKSVIYINKSSELDVSQEIKIDGSATLELVYL